MNKIAKLEKNNQINKKRKYNKINYKLILILVLSLITLFSFYFKSNQKGETMNETINLNDKNSDKTIVVFETNYGNFEVELDRKNAPITTKNFIEYVNEGFYDGLIFHRVIKGFMVQGGGFDINMKQKKTKEPIKNEADNGLKNLKYTIAMARTSEINSATSQFFINTNDNNFLDHGFRDYGYAVFGKVISGFETIDKIENVKTHSIGYYDDVPIEPVIINKGYLKN